jgi:hypothetical protein
MHNAAGKSKKKPKTGQAKIPATPAKYDGGPRNFRGGACSVCKTVLKPILYINVIII